MQHCADERLLQEPSFLHKCKIITIKTKTNSKNNKKIYDDGDKEEHEEKWEEGAMGAEIWTHTHKI